MSKLMKRRLAYALVSVTITLVFIFLTSSPVLSPDSQGHLRMAENLSRTGCMSYDDSCTATTTDQGPLYPIILRTGGLGQKGASPEHYALKIQTAFFVLVAAGLALYAKSSYHTTKRVTVTIFAISLLSPITMGWNRFILPDGISIAGTIVVAVAIDAYLRRDNIFYLYIGAVSVSILSINRYDSIVLLVPLIAAYLYGTLQSKSGVVNWLGRASRLILVIAISLLLSGIWSMRNISLGLQPIRPKVMGDLDRPIKREIVMWINTWSINQYDLEKGLWPYLSGKGAMEPPSWAVSPELRSYTGEFKKDLESERVLEEFKRQRLAIQRNKAFDFSNNVKRVIWQVFGPFYSSGMPSPLSDGESRIKDIVYAVSWKVINWTSRLVIVFGTIIRVRKRGVRPLVVCGLALLCTDVGLSLWAGQIEQRYLNDTFAFLQTMLVLSVVRNHENKCLSQEGV